MIYTCYLDVQEFCAYIVLFFFVVFLLISDLSTGEAYVSAQTFYDDLGTLAHQNG